eukprot:7154475-Alexandrium_andersonii.AAC.1
MSCKESGPSPAVEPGLSGADAQLGEQAEEVVEDVKLRAPRATRGMGELTDDEGRSRERAHL